MALRTYTNIVAFTPGIAIDEILCPIERRCSGFYTASNRHDVSIFTEGSDPEFDFEAGREALR